MLAFVIVLQVLVALFLIMVVLLQPGNRGGSAAALGGAGSDTVFGARGANTFLSKLTFGAATAFMLTNMALSYMSSSHGDKSVLDALQETTKTQASAPATDGAPTPPSEQANPADDKAGAADAVAPAAGTEEKKEPENH